MQRRGFVDGQARGLHNCRAHDSHSPLSTKGLQLTRERRKVEMAFAHLKRNLSFRRLRLRGITGAKDEFLLPGLSPANTSRKPP
jgi:DDE family transposase